MVEVVKGALKLVLSLPAEDVYAEAVPDYENHRMDYRLFIPAEGFGFSRQKTVKPLRPNFSEI